MKLGKLSFSSLIGKMFRQTVFIVGLVTIIFIISGTLFVANSEGQKAEKVFVTLSDIVAAINNVANAIATVAIVGPEGPQGPPGPIAAIYVNTRVQGPVGLLGTFILCDEGDIATGGGVTSNSQGSSGPFLHYSGPLLDDMDGAPVGWRIGIGDVLNDIEIHVICADVSAL